MTGLPTDGTPGTSPGAPSGDHPGDALDRALERYLQHLAVERGLAANTLAAYRRDLRRYQEYLAEGTQRPQVTLVRGQFKLVLCPGDPEQLFDLVTSPQGFPVPFDFFRFRWAPLTFRGSHLLVLSRASGNLHVVQASPAGFTEVTRAAVFTPGATSMTGPSIAGRRIFVRNSEEIVALAIEGK